MSQNYGLGRGLSSLIPQKKLSRDNNINSDSFGDKKDNNNAIPAVEFNQGVLEVEVTRIVANPYQPRVHFDQDKLKELANSITQHGILQPLVVTKKGEDFELIAGERRLEAAKIAGINKVPVIVKDIKDKQKLELAIVENIQRHNLNPIEEAKSFQQLMDEFQMNQEEVAEKMGKSRSVVANKVRLLKLPVEALRALKEETITEGHAKAILSLENPEKQKALLDLIIKNQLTVRQAESKTREVSIKSHKRIISIDPAIKDLEDKLSSVMGTKVKVTKSGGGGGKVIIDYYSNDELNKIIDNLSPKKESTEFSGGEKNYRDDTNLLAEKEEIKTAHTELSEDNFELSSKFSENRMGIITPVSEDEADSADDSLEEK